MWKRFLLLLPLGTGRHGTAQRTRELRDVEARSAGSVQLAFSYPRFTVQPPLSHSFAFGRWRGRGYHGYTTISIDYDCGERRRRRSLIGRFGGQRARPPSPLRATHRGHVPFWSYQSSVRFLGSSFHSQIDSSHFTHRAFHSLSHMKWRHAHIGRQRTTSSLLFP